MFRRVYSRNAYHIGPALAGGRRCRLTRPDDAGLLDGRIRPNVMWAMDLQFDTTADGRTLKTLNVIDEFTRQAIAINFDPAIDADADADADGVVAVLTTSPGSEALRLRALRQRSQVLSSRRERLVSIRQRHDAFRPSWLVMVERLDRVAQRKATRRAAQPVALRLAVGGPRDHGSLALRLHRQRPRTAHGELSPTEFSRQWTTTRQPKPHSDWTTKRAPSR